MSVAGRRLYLLFTPALCAGEPWGTLRAALRGGVDLVQWRVAEPDPQGLARCLKICSAAGVPVIVNNDVMAAVRARTAGAHVGQDDMPAGAARRLLGKQLLGVSTHDHRQVDAAVAAGADYVGFGPCFPTATKGYAEGKARDEIAAAARACPVPLFAIGGINADNLAMLLHLGISRIAISSAILAAPDPAAAARTLAGALQQAAT